MNLIQKSMVPLLALMSSGCLQYVLFMGTDQDKADASRKVLGEGVKEAREKKDCPRWIAGLNSAREKLPVLGDRGTSYYGSEVEDAYQDCLFKGLLELKAFPGTERERLTRLVERIDLVRSLPLDELKAAGRKDTTPPIPGKDQLPELRAEMSARIAELDRAAAEVLVLQTRRIDAATLAESKGWPVAALAAWLAVAPLDAPMKTRREEALTRLAPLARKHVAVAVWLMPAAAPPPLLVQVRGAPLLSTRPTLRLVERPEEATVEVQLGVGAFTRETDRQSVSFEHSYVSATKQVINPRLEKLKKDIASHDKEAAYWRGKVASIRCTGSGPCKPRISAQDNVRREDEKSARDRRELAAEKPTVRSDVTSVYSYTGDKTVLTASAPLTVTMASKHAPVPEKVTSAAKVQRTAIVYAGNAKVGLPGRSDPVPTAAELDTALTSECARLMAEAVLSAPALAAAEFDANARAATEPLERLHHALVRALRSGQAADVDAAGALQTSLLTTKVEPAALLRGLAAAP